MRDGDAEVVLGGVRLALLARRAAWWCATRTLIVSDVHLGKPAAFRAAGVPVPEGSSAADLADLAGLAGAYGAARLLILGDLLHAVSGRTPPVLEALAAFRARLGGVEVVLVRGNHDARAGDPPAGLEIRCVDGPWTDGAGAWFAHEPIGDGARDGVGIPAGVPLLCGHLHPGVSLRDPMGRRLRAACFWVRGSTMVLPAFGRFTGMHGVRAREGDRVFAAGPGVVTELALGGVRCAGRRRSYQ